MIYSPERMAEIREAYGEYSDKFLNVMNESTARNINFDNFWESQDLGKSLTSAINDVIIEKAAFVKKENSEHRCSFMRHNSTHIFNKYFLECNKPDLCLCILKL